MPSNMGFYDGLGNDVDIPVTFDELVDKICRMNYGVHRLLTALVRARRRTTKHNHYADELADAIEELLNNGLY